MFVCKACGARLDELETGSKHENLAVDKGMNQAGASRKAGKKDKVACIRGPGPQIFSIRTHERHTCVVGKTQHHVRFFEAFRPANVLQAES